MTWMASRGPPSLSAFGPELSPGYIYCLKFTEYWSVGAVPFIFGGSWLFFGRGEVQGKDPRNYTCLVACAACYPPCWLKNVYLPITSLIHKYVYTRKQLPRSHQNPGREEPAHLKFSQLHQRIPDCRQPPQSLKESHLEHRIS